jgi:hypothetical protein
MHMLMMPHMASAALAMPPATAAISDHGMRLLLDPQQQQRQQLVPAGGVQQHVLGHHRAHLGPSNTLQYMVGAETQRQHKPASR